MNHARDSISHSRVKKNLFSFCSLLRSRIALICSDRFRINETVELGFSVYVIKIGFNLKILF